MWACKDYFSSYFLSLLFSLLKQTVENAIFHHIFLSLFSILLIFTPTKHTLRLLIDCLKVKENVTNSSFQYLNMMFYNKLLYQLLWTQFF